MSRCHVTEEQLIDYYYGEVKNLELKEHIVQCSTCQEYLNSQEIFDEDLELFNIAIDNQVENQFGPNLDFIFAQADQIEKKSMVKETLLFGGVALGLLLVFFGLFMSWEIKLLAYFQIAAYFLMPIFLLPLLKLKQEKGVN